jgi:hypothetical protein
MQHSGETAAQYPGVFLHTLQIHSADSSAAASLAESNDLLE